MFYRQFDGHSNLNISPYAEDGCYLLLVLSGMPETATVLMESGLLEMFCHNTLTPILQQGQLDMFLRFGDSNQKYVERNPLHTVWCHMLCVLNNLLRTLSKNTDRALSDKVLQNVVSFLQIYGPQVDACFRLANGANDSLLGLTPSESLASCLLSEVDQLSMIMFELAKQLDRVMSYTANLFVAYKDCALTLLQRYLYFSLIQHIFKHNCIPSTIQNVNWQKNLSFHHHNNNRHYHPPHHHQYHHHPLTSRLVD